MSVQAAHPTWVGPPVIRTVTAESVRRFVAATAPAALVDDETWSRQADTDIVAPTYFCADPVAEVMAMGFVRPSDPPRSIDGGSAWEMGAPVRVGDTLTLIGLVADVIQRVTRDGRELVQTQVEVQAWNQNGDWVGVARGMIINYQERPQ